MNNNHDRDYTTGENDVLPIDEVLRDAISGGLGVMLSTPNGIERINPENFRATDWRPYHSALSQCAELLDNMPDEHSIFDTPKFLAEKLAASLTLADSASDERAMFEAWYKQDAGHEGRSELSKDPIEYGGTGEFTRPLTNRDFKVWQAARSVPARATKAATPAGEVIACEDYGTTIRWVTGIPRIGTWLYLHPPVESERVPPPVKQPIIGKLLDDMSQLQMLWGLGEPGALVRFSDVSKTLFDAAKAARSTTLTDDQIMDIAEPFHDVGGVKFDEVAFARHFLTIDNVPSRAAKDESSAPVEPIRNEHGEVVMLVRRTPDGCAQEILWMERESERARARGESIDSDRFAYLLDNYDRAAGAPSGSGMTEAYKAIIVYIDQWAEDRASSSGSPAAVEGATS